MSNPTALFGYVWVMSGNYTSALCSISGTQRTCTTGMHGDSDWLKHGTGVFFKHNSCLYVAYSLGPARSLT